MATSDIKVMPQKVFWNGVELGSTSGGIEMTTETSTVDITSDQTGSEVLDSFQTGTTATVTMTLLELNTVNYNLMIASATGSSKGSSEGNTGYGWGSSRNFTSMLARAQVLELRDTTSVVNSNSWNFWKAIPIVDSLSFASDAANTMSVTFRCFKDSSKDSTVDLLVKGDQDDTWT